MSTSVQFRGTDAVMQAYTDNDGKGWAIFEGNRLLFKGSDINSLGKVLTNMSACTPNNAYSTIYSLRIYETVTDRKKINYKLDWDCSFGFKLIGEDEEETRRSNHTSKRSAEIEALREEIRQLREEKEPAEENDQLGMIGQIFTHPVLGNYAGMILGNIVQRLIPGAPALPMQQQHAIGNVPGNGIAGNNDAGQLQIMPMDQIISELQKHDPRLQQHLQKLLQLAINDKNSFIFLTNTLDNM